MRKFVTPAEEAFIQGVTAMVERNKSRQTPSRQLVLATHGVEQMLALIDRLDGQLAEAHNTNAAKTEPHGK